MIAGLGPIHLRPSVGADGTGAELSGSGAAGGAGSAAATSFSEALTNAAAQAVGSLEKAETLSVEAIRGNADTRQVVDAVMNAQQALQAAVAIRDKIVSAYLEVSRMSI